jgi:hypothetical protein
MELSTYISSFREVNSIYAKFIETGLYGFDEQEIAINFFEEIKDIKKLEKVLFESSEALNFQSKFNAFKIVLNDNIKLYEENKELFDTLDVDKLCGIKSSCFNESIIIKQKEVDILFKDYWLSRGNLGDRFFKKAEENEHDPVWEEYIYKKQLYDWENEELDGLLKKREHILYYVLPYVHNKFSEICILSNSFLSILNSYKDDGLNDFQGKEYLNMGIIYKIFKLCNDKYFENTTCKIFYNYLNLSSKKGDLKIRKGKIIYVCHLIKKLAEKVDLNDEKEWRDEILNNLGLIDSFNKKSNQVEYNKGKEVSEAIHFVDELNEILKNE